MFGTITAFLVGGVASYPYSKSRDSVLAEEAEQQAAPEREATRNAGAPSLDTSAAVAASQSSSVAALSDGFLSSLMAQLWPYINDAAAQSIRDSVEPQFATLPGPLKTLHFTHVSLGTVPVRFDNIVVHAVDRTTNTLQINVDVHWDGTCDVRLKADYLGSFGVQSIKLFGRLSILMKPLVSTLSIVQAVQVAFINPPAVSLDFVGLANVADLKVVKHRIQAILADNIRTTMVLPTRLLTKLDTACPYLDCYEPPLGLCRFTLVNGQGFVVEQRTLRANDVPDCYVTLSLGDTTRRSRTCRNSVAPVWQDTMDFVLCDHDQIVSLDVYDEDDGSLDKDDWLGTAQASVRDMLLQTPGRRHAFALQDKDHKLTGAAVQVICDVLSFTTDLTSLQSKMGTNTTDGSTTTNQNQAASQEILGMLTVIVTQASDLPMKKEDVSACVKVDYGKHPKQQQFTTSTVTFYPGVDVLNPFFDSAFHIPLTVDMIDAELGKIRDLEFHLLNKDISLGSLSISHDTLVAVPDKVLTEKRPIGTNGAMLEYRVILRGVQSSRSASSQLGVDTTTTPTHAPSLVTEATENAPVPSMSSSRMIRVTVIKGVGFQVQTTRRVLRKKDIPDVYCIIKYGSSPTPWRTKTIKDNVAPVWNESQTFSFLNQSQILNLDVYDEDSGKRDADDFLGTARVTVGKILLAGGSHDVELEEEGKPTGMFITLACELI